MTKLMRKWPFFLILLIALGLGTAGWADDDDDDGDAIPLDDAEVFIEFNSTDGDFGIQFFWDGEPWKKMESPS